MKKKTYSKFITSLLLVFVYELIMIIFNLTGFSFFKILVSSLLWISVIICIGTFLKNYRQFRKSIPKLAFNTLKLIIIFNLINIGRGFFDESISTSTFLGNRHNTLALLLPFSIIFSHNKLNQIRINNYFILLLKIAIPIFILFFIISWGGFSETHLKILVLLLLPVVFLITIINYLGSNKIVLFSGILLFYISFVFSNRTMFLRELLLIICLISIYFYRKFNFKWIPKATFLLLFLPFLIFKSSLDSGESVFSQTELITSNKELSTDTRTFLYLEVFSDLLTNNSLLFGKGVNGTYYSPYFNATGGDTDTRLTVEVGVLSIILKVGLVGLILYLLILLISIYYAFFRSNNHYILGIGFMLSVYTILLFIKNPVAYSSNNLFIWFFIGTCLSINIRKMSNTEINLLFKFKN
jgi:hypothetical protein